MGMATLTDSSDACDSSCHAVCLREINLRSRQVYLRLHELHDMPTVEQVTSVTNAGKGAIGALQLAISCSRKAISCIEAELKAK